MKKIIGLIVFVVVVVGGYFVWQEIQRTESTDDAEDAENVCVFGRRWQRIYKGSRDQREGR